MKVYKTKEYRIMSVTSGKLLTANEDQLITVEAADEQKAQNWKFFPEENGCYRIVSTKSKKVVDIIAGGTVNGAWVHQWETVSANSQLWKLEEDGEAVRISSLSSGKYLDVALEDNRHVQIWERGGENQLWKIEVVEKKKEDLAALKKKIHPPLKNQSQLQSNRKNLLPLNIKSHPHSNTESHRQSRKKSRQQSNRLPKLLPRKEAERNNKMKKSCTKRYSFFCVDKSFYLDGRRIS